MAPTIRIAVFDDQPLYREGVIHSFSEQPSFTVVGEGASAQDAIAVARDRLPDVILLDLRMPGGGIEAARTIAIECPAVKMIMLTVSEDEQDVAAALEAGARGYVLKGIGGMELARAIISICEGESYVTPTLAAQLLRSARRGPQQVAPDAVTEARLNRREEQILELLATGKTNREIAGQLDLSEKTVKRYMTNILQKLQARNRVEAALASARLLKPAITSKAG